MRSSIQQSKHLLTLILTGILILFFSSCEKNIKGELNFPDNKLDNPIAQWDEILYQIDLESNVLFVQEGESLQKAINDASSGDIIYFGPGNYQENINVSIPNLKLVGVSLTPDDLIINESIESRLDIISLNKINNKQSKYNKRKGESRIKNFSRTNLGEGIAHYSFDVEMGDGEYDIIRIHRVVKEVSPYKAVRTKGDVFMVHGANQDFDDIFLTAGAHIINSNTSAPYYLASKDIDVWGIDMGWTRVSHEGISDYSFLNDWNMEKDIDHTIVAMSIARIVRGVTAQGFSKMNLLGFSYGVGIAYGTTNRETQMPKWFKNVKGIIPVDYSFKKAEEECNDVQKFKDYLSDGLYYNPWIDNFYLWGELALDKPDGHDVHPDLTNSQFLEYVGTQGFFAGENGQFTKTEPVRFFRLCVNLAYRMPTQIFLDMESIHCPSEGVSYDDYIGEITVPIYYIGANGGLHNDYTASLTASTDVTNHIIQDYGHADIWMARDASYVVWKDLESWLTNHR